jgi:GNAT superfamily N-acetyltransferase
MTAASTGVAREVEAAGASWWSARVPGDSDRAEAVVVVRSAYRLDGAHVRLAPDDPALTDWVTRAEISEDGDVQAVHLADHVAPRAPLLWYVEVRETMAQPPALNLVAFAAPGVPAGTIVPGGDFGVLPVSSPDQAGALRWYPASGEVDQVYVQPRWRRRGVGTALLHTAETLAIAREWPRLWADGQRTELGERFRHGAAWAHRAAELTHLAPPMTPGC